MTTRLRQLDAQVLARRSARAMRQHQPRAPSPRSTTGRRRRRRRAWPASRPAPARGWRRSPSRRASTAARSVRVELVAAGGVEAGVGLVEQPQLGAAGDRQASAVRRRWPADSRATRHVGEAAGRGPSAPARRRSRRRTRRRSRPRTRTFSRDGQVGRRGRWRGRAGRPGRGPRCARSPDRSRAPSPSPRASGSRPAQSRSSVVLPAPLGPLQQHDLAALDPQRGPGQHREPAEHGDHVDSSTAGGAAGIGADGSAMGRCTLPARLAPGSVATMSDGTGGGSTERRFGTSGAASVTTLGGTVTLGGGGVSGGSPTTADGRWRGRRDARRAAPGPSRGVLEPPEAAEGLALLGGRRHRPGADRARPVDVRVRRLPAVGHGHRGGPGPEPSWQTSSNSSRPRSAPCPSSIPATTVADAARRRTTHPGRTAVPARPHAGDDRSPAAPTTSAADAGAVAAADRAEGDVHRQPAASRAIGRREERRRRRHRGRPEAGARPLPADADAGRAGQRRDRRSPHDVRRPVPPHRRARARRRDHVHQPLLAAVRVHGDRHRDRRTLRRARHQHDGSARWPR